MYNITDQRLDAACERTLFLPAKIKLNHLTAEEIYSIIRCDAPILGRIMEGMAALPCKTGMENPISIRKKHYDYSVRILRSAKKPFIQSFLTGVQWLMAILSSNVQAKASSRKSVD